MPCYSPIRGQRDASGRIRRTTYHPAFKQAEVESSCGRCIGCKIEYSRQWAVRMVHELHCHDRASFVTLTFKDSELPPNGSLDIRYWQLFAKRLRKRLGKFRFYQCGEYAPPLPGSNANLGRPHHHAILYGMDFKADRQHYKTVNGNHLYTSQQLTDTWTHGHAVIGDVTFESCQYVAGYVTKKISGERATAHYEGKTPEFSSQSRRPGIGAMWFHWYHDQVYPRDEIIAKGYRQKPPRYYDTRLAEFNPALMERIKSDRVKAAEERAHDSTPDRLAVREKCAKAKLTLRSTRQ